MASQTSGVSAPPPSFVSSAHLLRLHSVALSRMNKLNKTGPSTDPRGTAGDVQPGDEKAPG